MNTYRDSGLVAPGEVVALEQAGHGGLVGKPNHALGTQGLAPFRVLAYLGLVGIKDKTGLLKIGLGVDRNVLRRSIVFSRCRIWTCKATSVKC